MQKTSLRDMPVITIHILPSDKNSLIEQADKKGMKLATYCRMILLEKINKG